jgi:protein TonB
MFNDTFLDGRAESRRPWTIAVSLLAQCLAVALAALISLLSAGDLPARQWIAHLLAPPPIPPAAPAAESPRAAAPREPAPRFEESTFVAPAVIPDRIAAIVDPPAEVSFGSEGVGGAVAVPGTVPGLTSGVLPPLAEVNPPPAPAAPKAESPRPQQPVVVSSDLQAARLIHRVEPVYPALARQAGVSGEVRLEAIIAEDGTIRQLRVLGGHPLLVPSAREAVSRWRYRPTLLGGVAVPVLTRIDVKFVLR